MRARFRTGFYLGLTLALALGIFLTWWWQPERQVQRHTERLISGIQRHRWNTVSSLLANDYHDQWRHDNLTLVARLRQASPYLRGAAITVHDPAVSIDNIQGVWEARITLDGEGEALAVIQERINRLDSPFRLEWRRVSRKPWDWKLVGVTNADLEIAGELY